jgi:hypothetical protein
VFSRLFTHRRTPLLAYGLSCLLLISLLWLSGGNAHAASTLVNIYDNAHVLDAAQVEKVATTFPYTLDIYTLNTFEGDTGQLAQFARSHMTTYRSGMIVMMIDTVHRHLAIVDNGQVSQNRVTITDQQYQDAFRQAIGANNYTAVTIAALQSLIQAASQNKQNNWNILWVVLGLLVLFLICCILAAIWTKDSGGDGGSSGSRRTYVYSSSNNGGGSSPGSGSGGVAGSF